MADQNPFLEQMGADQNPSLEQMGADQNRGDRSPGDQNPGETPFEPTILAFCCRHCAYAAADLAGGMRIQYPSNVRIIEVPCSGRVEVTEVLHAFERGVDGVMVAG